MKKIPKKVIWFTGLSGSGKSTLANSLISQLRKQKFSCILLDGDEVRSGLCADLAFSENDRIENIRRIAEMASLLLKQNDFVVVATISPNDFLRNQAKKIITGKLFNLIYLSTPFDVCLARDTKGLYKKAFEGKIKNFTGIGARFSPPKKYHLIIDTNQSKIKDSLSQILKMLNVD
jgi:adenylyl-sulfate kinase